MSRVHDKDTPKIRTKDLLEIKFICELRRALQTIGIEAGPSLACHYCREYLSASLGGVKS